MVLDCFTLDCFGLEVFLSYAYHVNQVNQLKLVIDVG